MAPRVKRGRPPKFGRPSRVVAVTLPEETIRGLRKLHHDLAWSIVTLFEKHTKAQREQPQANAELIDIADRRSLIVVNSAVIRRLPGVHIIPLNGHRAFLALESGLGLADLELAVRDRLDQGSVKARERAALEELRALLSKWRHDRRLRIYSRAIIVVERAGRGRSRLG
jgi:hypothetical protein